MKPKKPTKATKCTTCNNRLGDQKALNCQLCIQWVCLPCSDVSEAPYDFCEANKEGMAFLCKECKLEIPALREMKSIKARQTQIETRHTQIETNLTQLDLTQTQIQTDLAGLQGDVVETNSTIADLTETQDLQGQEINKHENDLKENWKQQCQP